MVFVWDYNLCIHLYICTFYKRGSIFSETCFLKLFFGEYWRAKFQKKCKGIIYFVKSLFRVRQSLSSVWIQIFKIYIFFKEKSFWESMLLDCPTLPHCLLKLICLLVHTVFKKYLSLYIWVLGLFYSLKSNGAPTNFTCAYLLFLYSFWCHYTILKIVRTIFLFKVIGKFNFLYLIFVNRNTT